LLATDSLATPAVEVGDNATVRLDLENEVQPDALLRLDGSLGGRSRITEDDFLEGPPARHCLTGACSLRGPNLV